MKKVWVDTDVAIGEEDARGGFADVDDAFAIIQLFHAPNVEVKGISSVFGNSELPNVDRVARFLSQRFGPEPLVDVFTGAAGPMKIGDLRHNEATLALKTALEKESLHILAIGPASNIGTFLLLEPQLSKRIREIVLVAGRQSKDQHFRVSEAHHPPFPDLNFELDPVAFQVLLQSEVNVVLHPFEISSKVWVNEADLQELMGAGGAAAYLGEYSMPWLNQWKAFSEKGFNPFDVLASAYLVDDSFFQYKDLPASIHFHRDDMLDSPTAFKPYLILSEESPSTRRWRYCHTVGPEFKKWLWEMLKNKPNLLSTKK